jgi:hypothetical protein
MQSNEIGIGSTYSMIRKNDRSCRRDPIQGCEYQIKLLRVLSINEQCGQVGTKKLGENISRSFSVSS